MNTCIRATFECSWEKIEARIKEDMAGEPGTWIAAWEIAQISSNSMIWVGEITDMESFGAFMDSDYNKKWDEDNGVVVTAYSLTEMAE
jgi:hypothetical protein